MAFGFLCTRLKNPDIDDYKKLTRLMQYIRDMTKIALNIKPSDYPKWWVDSYYTIHPDMKSHTGIFMTLGKEPCTQHLATKIENKEL